MLILDAHVHVYPFYVESRLLHTAVTRLSTLAMPNDSIGIILVEREGVDVFAKWEAGNVPAGWKMERMEEVTLRLTSPEGHKLWVFAGRQVACRERLEILFAGVRAKPKDGISCEEAIEMATRMGGKPMLAWGVGKWLLGRAKVVRALVEKHKGDTLWICDTSLRPMGWPLEGWTRKAGRPIVCGSDPLPKAGEDAQAGRYACSIEVEVPEEKPWAAVAAAVNSGRTSPCGHRNTWAEFLKRR